MDLDAFASVAMDSEYRTKLHSSWNADGPVSSNEERIMYILKHVLPYDKLFNSMIDKAMCHTPKSATKSATFADTATQLSSAGKWREALTYVKKALVYAETPTSNSSLSDSSNRVMLYAQMGEILNQLGYPQGGVWSLEQALGLHQAEVTGPSRDDLLVLLAKYQEAYSKTPFKGSLDDKLLKEANEVNGKKVRSCLFLPDDEGSLPVSFDDNPQTGPHLVAARTIPAGTTISFEEVHALVRDGAKKWVCDSCSFPLAYMYFPCSGCTRAIYCGPKCAKTHGEEWHKRCCGGLLETLTTLDPSARCLFQLVCKVGGPSKLLDLAKVKKQFILKKWDQFDFLSFGGK